MAESFPVLHVKGSHYDVGYSTGSTFQSRIQNYIQKSDLLQDSLLPFYDSPDGRQVVDTVLAITEKNFPMYVDEIRGTAQGAGLPFETMFVNSMQMDIYFGFSHKLPNLSKEDFGCSTVFVNRPDEKIIGHNEDGELLVKSHGYFIEATIENNGQEEESFTSLCYPGCLSGNAISFNKHGLTFTINALVHPTVEQTTPVDFVTRAMLKATDIDEVKQIVSNLGYGSSSGVGINIGSVVDTSTQWSVEILPGTQKSKVSVKTITESDNTNDASYFHMNEYRHAQVQAESGGTSVHRMKRAMEHPLPTCVRDVRSILGDISNQNYPIYRTPRSTDEAATVCTGIFDFLGKTVDVYFDNPNKDCKPLLTFRL